VRAVVPLTFGFNLHVRAGNKTNFSFAFPLHSPFGRGEGARQKIPSFHRLDFAAARRQNRGMADENSRRTEKLESHVAHLEHQVEQLNAVVIEQGKLLERLKKETQRQSRAMEALELERIQSNNPKPPHYQ
jgi:SlyX protein